MRYDPLRQNRQSRRLPDHDYSQPGAYFITLCTHNRLTLFGEVAAGKMCLSSSGRVGKRRFSTMVQGRFMNRPTKMKRPSREGSGAGA
jgi:hypothetical protein